MPSLQFGFALIVYSMQVSLGGALVFASGILIGSAKVRRTAAGSRFQGSKSVAVAFRKRVS